MKIKTSELIDIALDWAVAKCRKQSFTFGNFEYDLDGRIYQRGGCSVERHYSEDWSLAGPIIEQEGINLNFFQFDNPQYWTAHVRHSDTTRFGSFGPTPLAAAMRCFVSSRLGDEVEVPDELLEEEQAAATHERPRQS